MVACPSSVQTWLHPLLRDCPRGRLGSLQRLTIKPRHLISMMVTTMLTGMFSSLAWAEPMTIVPVGPRINTTNDLSFRHEQPGLIITLVPWLAISALGEAVSIDVGTGPAFFSNYKFGGQELWKPGPNRRHCRLGFNVIPGFLQSTASSISRMLAHTVPTKPVWTCISSKSTSDSERRQEGARRLMRPPAKAILKV